jgi:hypothetical protein
MHFGETNRTMPHMHSCFARSTVVISNEEMHSPSAHPWQPFIPAHPKLTITHQSWLSPADMASSSSKTVSFATMDQNLSERKSEREGNLHVARNTMAPLLVLLSVLLVSCVAQSSWLRNGGRRGEVGMGTVLHRLVETIHFGTPSLLVCKMRHPDGSPLGENNGYAQFYPRAIFAFAFASCS